MVELVCLLVVNRLRRGAVCVPLGGVLGSDEVVVHPGLATRNPDVDHATGGDPADEVRKDDGVHRVEVGVFLAARVVGAAGDVASVGVERLTAPAPFEDEPFHAAADVEVHAGCYFPPRRGSGQRPRAAVHPLRGGGLATCGADLAGEPQGCGDVLPVESVAFGDGGGMDGGDLSLDTQFPAVGAADRDVGAAAPLRGGALGDGADSVPPAVSVEA